MRVRRVGLPGQAFAVHSSGFTKFAASGRYCVDYENPLVRSLRHVRLAILMAGADATDGQKIRCRQRAADAHARMRLRLTGSLALRDEGPLPADSRLMHA